MRYLDCLEGTFPWKIRQLLEGNSTAIDPAVVQVWRDLIGEFPQRSTPCCLRYPMNGLTRRKRGTP